MNTSTFPLLALCVYCERMFVILVMSSLVDVAIHFSDPRDVCILCIMHFCIAGSVSAVLSSILSTGYPDLYCFTMMRKLSDLLGDHANMAYTEMYIPCGIYTLEEYMRWRKCNETIEYIMVSRLIFIILVFEYTIISIIALATMCH